MNWRRTLWNGFTSAHVPAYRATRGRLPWVLGRGRTALVDHVGRRSGVRRTTPLLYLADGDDVVIVASKGGAPRHPAWFHNLSEMETTEVQIGGERRRVSVRRATPDERRRLWPKLVEIWSDYETYQRRTEREIPLLILSLAAGS